MNINHIKLLFTFLPTTAKWVSFCLLLVPTLSYSQDNILAVMSGDGKIYQTFYSTLKDKLENKSQTNITLTQVSASEVNNKILNKYNLIISIGYKAATIVAKHNPKTTVIYSLIPDDGPLLASIPCKNKSCYKVFINQPVSRYIALFKIVFPYKNNLAFATTQANSHKSQQLKMAARLNGFIYNEIIIKQDSNIARTLTNKLNKNDILLALPDSAIYNSGNAKSIILSSYHKNVPIIAYSQSFAKAGALTSLFSSVDNIANKTANIANKIIQNGSQTEKEYYPDDFAIVINSAVAHSLNIDIDSEKTIKRKIK